MCPCGKFKSEQSQKQKHISKDDFFINREWDSKVIRYMVYFYHRSPTTIAKQPNSKENMRIAQQKNDEKAHNTRSTMYAHKCRNIWMVY